MRDLDLYDSFAASLRAREATPLSFAITNTPDAIARTKAGLAVYRNNIRSSLSTALAETFPVCTELVGEDFFKFTANEYFNAHPPSSPLISNYGLIFPAFLEGFDPAKSVPYLSDMAQLELAWLRAYRAQNATPLTIEQIMEKAGDDPSQLCLKLHPSLQLLQSNYPVASLWQHHKEQSPGAAFTKTNAEQVLIIRPHLDVLVHNLSPGLFLMIQKLSEHRSIGEALEEAASLDQAFDPTDAFGKIFSTQIVTGIDTNITNTSGEKS